VRKSPITPRTISAWTTPYASGWRSETWLPRRGDHLEGVAEPGVDELDEVVGQRQRRLAQRHHVDPVERVEGGVERGQGEHRRRAGRHPSHAGRGLVLEVHVERPDVPHPAGDRLPEGLLVAGSDEGVRR
jgi:hypothetical protein